MLHVFLSARKHLESHEMPGPSNGNDDTRQNFYRSGGHDNFSLDTGAGDQKVDFRPDAFVQRRRDQPHGSQAAIFPLDHGAFWMISIPTHPEGEDDILRLTLSRDGKRHVQVPGGSRLRPQDDRETSNKGPLCPHRPEVSVQPDQRFRKTFQQRGASLRYFLEAGEGST